MILWGIGMALTESVLLSLVAGVVEPAKRATAFGLFDTGFGVAWFVGSALMGVLYQTSIVGLLFRGSGSNKVPPQRVGHLRPAK